MTSDQQEEAGAGDKKKATRGFQLRMPHRERKEEILMPPRGCTAVRVGQEGEEQRRFVVPVACLSHPLFAQLLDEAAEEYGFCQPPGAIAIPCGVDHFRRVHDIIVRERGGRAAGRLHHRLPHLSACFGD